MTNKELSEVSVAVIKFTWHEGYLKEDKQLYSEIIEGGINKEGNYFLVPESTKARRKSRSKSKEMK